MLPEGAADVERIEVDYCPSGAELDAWQDWFRHHGIDPNYVPTSNTIERRPAARQIVLDVYEKHGGCDCGRCDGIYMTGRILPQQIFQLDEPPLPFPALRNGSDSD